MDKNFSRMDKLNSEFQKDLYEVITRKIKNPYITEMISILKVETSKDLAHCRAYISVFSTNEERKKATFEAIKSEAKRIRYEMSKISKLRKVPDFEFVLDGSIAYSDKMEKLFIQIHKEEN